MIIIIIAVNCQKKLIKARKLLACISSNCLFILIFFYLSETPVTFMLDIVPTGQLVQTDSACSVLVFILFVLQFG